MTKETDTVRKFVDAFNGGDTKTMSNILDDGFKFQVAGAPKTFAKRDFLQMMENLRTAFPDWRFENVNIQSDENPVRAKMDTMGTHEGPLDLSMIGGTTVQPTGKSFKNAQEPATFVIKNGKITEHSVDSEEGGVVGMLSQLGIEPPTPPTRN